MIMKKLFKTLSKVFGAVVILILVVLIGEWVYSEIKFQIWLNQDEHRVDFSDYDDAEELRDALLVKLPLGSSEEDVQTFIEANGYIFRRPVDNKSYGPFSTGLLVSQTGRGFFDLREFFHLAWGIRFVFNPKDHTLIDILVVSQPRV